MSQREENKIPAPDSVSSDADAIEITRMWWSRGEPVMSIMPAFSDPAHYGQMLAQAAKHMAHGYSVRHGHNEREVYARILKGMNDVIKADNVQTITELPKGASQ